MSNKIGKERYRTIAMVVMISSKSKRLDHTSITRANASARALYEHSRIKQPLSRTLLNATVHHIPLLSGSILGIRKRKLK